MYGNFDERGLRIPQYYGGGGYNQQQGNNFNQNIGTTRSEQMMQGSMGGMSNMMQADRNFNNQGNYRQNYGGSQYGQNQYGSGNYGTGGNQFGSYSQNATGDIGTTRTEQYMQGGMGGMSSVMQADRNYNNQGAYRQNYGGPQYGQNQFSSGNYGTSANQFGSYNQNATRDIGTTGTEQYMRGGMGGMSSVMQADRNYNNQGSYGQYTGGNQYGHGQNQYGGSNYGCGYGTSNQFGSYNQNATRDIGTTGSEQSMQGGMGGMSSMMQADRNYNNQGSYGQYTGGNQYGYGQNQYGGSNYGSGYGTSANQFGSYNQNATRDIGTTGSEQSMQGGMGGMSSVMQADHNYNNPGGYGQSTGGNQYGYGQNQYGGGNYGSGYGTSNQFGSYNQNATRDIGTTGSEQSMQGGMGGMSSVMQADHRGQQTPGQYGYGTTTNSQGYAGTGYGYGSQYSNQLGNQGYTASQQTGYNNPGDTAMEQAAKRNISSSSTGFQGDEF